MRQCGDCSECCVVGYVPEIEKEAHTPCPFIKECTSGSCSIFDKKELPNTCKNYECSWIKGFGINSDRPKENRVLFTSNLLENQQYFTAIELSENAITTSGAGMAVNIAMTTNIPIIIVKYGVKPPEDNGNWIIITEKTLPRCSRIAGDLIHRFNDEVAMYDLLKGK